MSVAPPTELENRFPADQRPPRSFAERGAYLPLTTAAFFGCRARSANIASIEFILPHPLGGRSVFILPRGALDDVAAPTLHDREIFRMVSALREPRPADVRRLWREAAGQGWGGRAAARVAANAAEKLPEARRALEGRLLSMLGAEPGPEAQKAALAQLAQRLGQSPERLIERIGELAALLAEIGWHDAAPASLLRRLRRLTGLHGALQTMPDGAPPPSGLSDFLFLLGRIIRSADLLLREGEASLVEPREVLGLWLSKPQELAARLSRVDWLLDGWDIIPHLWQQAPPEQKREALAEMMAMAPLLPLEAAELPGMEGLPEFDRPPPPEPPAQGVRSTWLNDRVTRNEELLSLCHDNPA